MELLRARLRTEGYRHELVNASISGETTSGGRARLPALLERHRPALLLIELGGNDGLRGVALTELRDNLRAMIAMAQQHNARVLLMQMELPPNYGAAFTDRFRAVYRDVSRDAGIALAPFLLDGIALRTELMQPDGIHPRGEAAPGMVANIWPALVAELAHLK